MKRTSQVYIFIGYWNSSSVEAAVLPEAVQLQILLSVAGKVTVRLFANKLRRLSTLVPQMLAQSLAVLVASTTRVTFKRLG
jgi:Tfp pilus assembly protein PilN